MDYDFSGTKEQNALVEQELQKLKKEYHKQQMTKEQQEQLFEKMKEAKNMNQIGEKRTGMIKFAVAAAALIAIFVALPNTSATIANAMEQIPIIGGLVKVVTFRNYEYKTERNMADIEIPEIKPENQTEDIEIQ